MTTPSSAVKPEVWARLADSLRHDAPAAGLGDGLASRGAGLQRPESVLANARGSLFVSDKRGGVLEIRPDGSQRLSGTSSLFPNGIAMQRGGNFLVANLEEHGGVWNIGTDGKVSPWLTEFEGRPLHRVNFVMNDVQGRVWACISATEGGDKYPLDSATGYVLMRDASGTRVVADGLHFPSEG